MVDELKIVKIMNEAMLKTHKDNQQNYQKHIEIRENLKDDAIFFKIEKAKANDILKTVGVQKEQIENVYKKLISPNYFYELLKRGKINKDDKNIIIKYDTYNSEKLFNRKK